ncbi:MAG: SRPBCC domain-containing protein [Pseudomonadota bacterium]
MQTKKIWEIALERNAVFNAWVSSDTVIAPAASMDIKPVVGGHYRLFMEAGSDAPSNEGKFLEIDRNELVKYTWNWVGSDEVTTITVRFLAADNGGTRIELLHEGFLTLESRDMHDAGWDSYFTGLKQYLLSK